MITDHNELTREQVREMATPQYQLISLIDFYIEKAQIGEMTAEEVVDIIDIFMTDGEAIQEMVDDIKDLYPEHFEGEV